MLTETETDARPTIRACSCGDRGIPTSFFHRIRLSRLFFDHHGPDGQSYLASPKWHDVLAYKRSIFLFTVFFPFSKWRFLISDCFRNFEGSDIANGSHNSDVIVESRIEHVEASGRMNALHESRLSQVHVTCICCIKDAAYLLQIGSCHARAVDITLAGLKNNALRHPFSRKMIIIYFCNRHIKQN